VNPLGKIYQRQKRVGNTRRRVLKEITILGFFFYFPLTILGLLAIALLLLLLRRRLLLVIAVLILPTNQRVTKRNRLSRLTNSALVYESKYGVTGGGLRGVSQ
jgi:hypothetical protein